MLRRVSTVRFSVVVPAFNEAQYLPRLLDSVDAARARFDAGPEAVEVVVADNGSTDATAEVALARGCRVAPVERRAIAAARNGGAAMATGEYLCFVDADTRIHADTFTAMNSFVRAGGCAGGSTGWRMERNSPGIFCTTLVARFLTWMAGANGVFVFCRRDLFHEIGGYNEAKRYAEDVEFFRAMRKAAKKHGLNVVWNTGTPATVSARKFDRHGDWHMFYMGFWILRNRSLNKTVDNYWYNDSERF